MHFHHQLNNQWKYYSTSICVGDNSVNSVSQWVWAPGKKCTWRMSCKTKGQGDDAGREEISNLEFNDQSTDSSLRKEYGTLHLTFVEQSARTMKKSSFANTYNIHQVISYAIIFMDKCWMYEAFNAICSIVMTCEFIKSISLYVISIQRNKAFFHFKIWEKHIPTNKQNIKIQKAGQNKSYIILCWFYKYK